MAKEKLIKELELGLNNPNIPDNLKDKIRLKIADLKKEKQETSKTTDVRSLIEYKPKFKKGDVVVSKKDNSTYTVDSFVRRDKDFIYTLTNDIKNNIYHLEEADLKLKNSPKSAPSKQEILSVLYNADAKGYSATKSDSGGTIRASEELTEKYANAVSKNLTSIAKGSLSEEIYDELVDGNNHLLNEFLAWNGYYNSETENSLQKMYKTIWERGNRQAANPEIMNLNYKKIQKPSNVKPLKKSLKKYYSNRDIKSVTILENGKKVTYSGKDVFNGANFLKEGGLLVSKATYVPIRNVVEVNFVDGSKEKPINGYHIKNGATPIMEKGGEVWQPIVKLVPLELEPLSSQLKSYTGDSLSVDNYTNEEGKDYSTKSGEIIVHKKSGRKFEIPQKIYNYVDGYNLVIDKKNNKIITWEEGKLVAEVKDGKLDFSNKDKSISINKTKVESEFEKGFIPEKSNEKWAYIAVENKLQKLYAVAEDLEDDKTSAAWKTNHEKIKKFEDYLHRLERKYAHGGSVELPEGSFQHFENHYLEKGGEVESVTKEQIVQYLETVPAEKLANDYAYIMSKDLDRALYQANDPDFRPQLIDILANEITANRNIKNKKVLLQEIEYLSFGGRLKSALNRDRKYVNKSEDYEVRYAKGKNRKGYKKFAKGGKVKTSVDLFENYELQPENLQEIVSNYNNKAEEGELDYEDMLNFQKEVEAIGYTFDYGLDNEPFGLRPIGTELEEDDEENGYFAKGGEVGDYAKVPVGYNMTHYGLIKKVITNDVLYPENGYEIAGIGDILHPEQFEVISSAEFNKLKKQGTEVKPNHFLIIEEKFEKGGELKTYKSYKEFIDDNIGKKEEILLASNGYTSNISTSQTKESIDAAFKELIFHNFLDREFYSNYASNESKEAYKNLVNEYFILLKKSPKEFSYFWKNFIEKSGRTGYLYDLKNPDYSKNGKRIELDMEYYVKNNGKKRYFVESTFGEKTPHEAPKHYPNLIFIKFKENVPNKLKSEYESYLKEYAGEELKFEKGGVLSKGDEVKHLVSKKHGKVISVKELNGLEDEVVVEFEDGTTETLNSFDVEKVLEIKAKKTYDPSSGLTLEEWKAKHNIQNYGKGGEIEQTQFVLFKNQKDLKTIQNVLEEYDGHTNERDRIRNSGKIYYNVDGNMMILFSNTSVDMIMDLSPRYGVEPEKFSKETNYKKGGKTGVGKGAIFAIAKEIRKPGEKWQDAVARAGKLNK